MAPSAMDIDSQGSAPEAGLPPPKLYTPREAHFEKFIDIQADGYRKAKSHNGGTAAIVIDNGNLPSAKSSLSAQLTLSRAGSSATRAGWSFEDAPRLNLIPIFSKYRDRKLGRSFSFVGADVLADTTARGHMRNAFEAGSGIVSNWDVMESLLDYVFVKMGIDGSNGGVDVPIVMTEAVANLSYSRKCECFLDPLSN